MELAVFNMNASSYELVGYIENPNYVEYTETFNDDTFFKVVAILTDQNKEILSEGQMIWIENDICGITTYIHKSKESGTVTISGKLFQSIIERRNILQENHIPSATVGGVLIQMFQGINIPTVIFSISSNLGGETRISYDVPIGNLYSIVQDFCKEYNIGFKSSFDPERKRFTITFFEGEDKSDIVVSKTYDNWNSPGYEENSNDFYTSVSVVGEDRTVVVYADPQISQNQLNSKEYVINCKNTYKKEQTDLQYEAVLRKKGEEFLKEHIKDISYTGEFRNQTFLYKTDFNLGDTISVMDKDLSISDEQRVIQATVRQDSSGRYLFLTFNALQKTLVTVLKAISTKEKEDIIETAKENSPNLTYTGTDFPSQYTNIIHNGDMFFQTADATSSMVKNIFEYRNGWQLVSRVSTANRVFVSNDTPVPASDGDIWFALTSYNPPYYKVGYVYKYITNEWVIQGSFPSGGVGKDLGNGNEIFNDYSDNSIVNSEYCTVKGKENTLDGSYRTILGGQSNSISGAFDSIIVAEGLDISPASGETVAINQSLITGKEHTTIGPGGAGIVVESIICGFGHQLSGAHQCLMSGEYGIARGLLVCGNGNSQSGVRGNVLELDANGNLTIAGRFTPGGADFAETYEWLDGNPNDEDRRGRFVTLEGDKIILADENSDYILGIVSAAPTICGDTYDTEWRGKYLHDVFGAAIYDDNGKRAVSPEYDPEKSYIPQSERSEKAAIGTHGKLVIVDDGTCKVNGYCKPTIGGIATLSKEKTEYRVIERKDENHIRIVIK